MRPQAALAVVSLAQATRLGGIYGLIIFAGILCMWWWTPAPPRNPNLVIVTLDTTRADHLPTYGYFRDTMPRLDTLAEQSIVFERCMAPIAVTFPSHLSLFTGAYPHEHGALENPGSGDRGFAGTGSLRPLAKVLADADYQTAAFVSATSVKAYTGIDIGFDVFIEPSGHECRAEVTTAESLHWLERRKPGPYFLWVHYFDPHIAYVPPEPFASMYASDDVHRARLDARRVPREKVKAPRHTEELTYAQLHNSYDGELSYLDEQLGRLIDAVRSSPEESRRTVIVVVGDHGEGLGQHGEIVHGGIWNEQLHVPLFIHVPGQRARRIAETTSIVDILSTLDGLVELPGMEALLAPVAGPDRTAGRPSGGYVLAQESNASWRKRFHDGVPRYVLIGDRWKLVYDPDGEDRLFDLSRDPFELEDVAGRYPKITSELRAELLKTVAEQEKRFALLHPAEEGEVPVAPAIREQLRTLGYLE